MTTITQKFEQLNPTYVESALKVQPSQLPSFFRSDSMNLLREKINRIWHFLKTKGIWINERKIDQLLRLNTLQAKPVFPKKRSIIPQTYVYGIPKYSVFPNLQQFKIDPKASLVDRKRQFPTRLPPCPKPDSALLSQKNALLRNHLEKGGNPHNELLTCINENNEEGVHLCFKAGAYPQARVGTFPLYIGALQHRNPKIMQSFLDYGFSYQNSEGKMDPSFQEIMLAHASPEVLELFLIEGLDPDQNARLALYNIFYLNHQHEHLKVFHRNGMSEELYLDWIRQKMLAHRFDVNVAKLSLEAFHHSQTILEMFKSLQKFFKYFPDSYSELTPKARQTILEAFEHAAKEAESDPHLENSNRFSLYKQGKMVLIPGGWDTHAVYRVIYKYFFVECNRGAQFEQETPPGIQVYRVDNLNARDFAQAQCKTSLGEAHQAQASFLQKSKATKLIQFGLKPHEKGICAWAGLKTAFRGMLYILITEELQRQFLAKYGPGNLPKKAIQQTAKKIRPQAEKLSRKIYKSWSKWDREYGLLKALRNYETSNTVQPNEALFKLIKKKFRGSSDTKSLMEIILKIKTKTA